MAPVDYGLPDRPRRATPVRLRRCWVTTPTKPSLEGRGGERSAQAEGLAARVTACAEGGGVPVIVFEPRESEQPADRLERLGVLIRALQARKLLFLHRPGGLHQGGALVPIVNLTTDV